MLALPGHYRADGKTAQCAGDKLTIKLEVSEEGTDWKRHTQGRSLEGAPAEFIAYDGRPKLARRFRAHLTLTLFAFGGWAAVRPNRSGLWPPMAQAVGVTPLPCTRQATRLHFRLFLGCA